MAAASLMPPKSHSYFSCGNSNPEPNRKKNNGKYRPSLTDTVQNYHSYRGSKNYVPPFVISLSLFLHKHCKNA